MIRTHRPVALVSLITVFAGILAAAPPAVPGERGHLVLIGGGSKPRVVLRTFVELAGGPAGPIVVIPTASGEPDTGSYYEQLFRTDVGCQDVTSLEIRTREDAARPEFVAQVQRAGGCFFSGGDQNRITAVLLETPVGSAIHDLYWRGGVIGGTSAGTACQSDPMLTGEADLTVIAAGNVELAPGLGFFPDAIVDQHFVARQRQNRLLSVVLEHPTMLGIGVDEATAVWLKPNLTFQVLGQGSVVVYDAAGATVHRPAHRRSKNLGVTNLTTHVLLPGMSYSLPRRRPLP